jgi:hypothetical protein
VVTVPENMDAIHSMTWANWRTSAKKTAETLEISQECVTFITHMSDIRNLSAKWAPKCMYEDEKHDRVVEASQEISGHFRWRAAGFLVQLATMYETWIHLYDPGTKEHLRSGDTVVPPSKKSFEHISQPPR